MTRGLFPFDNGTSKEKYLIQNYEDHVMNANIETFYPKNCSLSQRDGSVGRRKHGGPEFEPLKCR